VLGQATEFVPNERKAIWRIKKFGGGTEHTLRAKISLSSPAQLAAIKRDVGPISLTFEIPMYNVSNLQVRYLRINEANPSYNPYRWVRYVTKSNSYVCRI
jgi:AP-4 complex subunit mu-1